jgi:hypothetical protein
MTTRLVDLLHDVALIEHSTGTGSVWSWSCQLCPSWGHGATSEHAALTEIADHVSIFCPVGLGESDGAGPD